MMRNMRDLSAYVSLSANKTNSTFPYVTVQNFEEMGMRLRKQTGFAMLLWAPVVQQDKADQWLQYSSTHMDWLQNSREYQVDIHANSGNATFDMEDYGSSPVSKIFYINQENGSEMHHVAVDDEGYHLPVWQQSPPPFDMNFVNQDLFQQAYVKHGLQAAKITGGKKLFEGLGNMVEFQRLTCALS
jgi:hypothetical protein